MRPRGTSVNWQVSAGDEQAMRRGRDDQHISLLLRLFQYLGWSMSSHCMPPLASMAEVMSLVVVLVMLTGWPTKLRILNCRCLFVEYLHLNKLH